MELHQYNVTTVVGGTQSFQMSLSFKLQKGGGSQEEEEGNRNSPEQNYQCRARQAQSKNKNKLEFRTIHDPLSQP